MTITRHGPRERLARHRHRTPYAALVLAGGYVEAGCGARIRAAPGTVVLHGAFEAHADGFGGAGAVVLNLPLAADAAPGCGTIADVDAIARLAERDPFAAAEALIADFRPDQRRCDDWPDALAAALEANTECSIGDWARAAGLHPAAASRGFLRAYGVSPKRYRLEARTRAALRSLPGWRGTLAALAADHGFADQAHLARAVVSIAGAPPAALRAKSVQARRMPAD